MPQTINNSVTGSVSISIANIVRGIGISTLTGVTSNTTTFTKTSHGLANGMAVTFASGNGFGLSSTITYYVINAATDTFQISTISGGASVALTAVSSPGASVYYESSNGDDALTNYSFLVNGSSKTWTTAKLVPIYKGSLKTKTKFIINFNDFAPDIFIKNWQIDFGDGEQILNNRDLFTKIASTNLTSNEVTLNNTTNLISGQTYFISSKNVLPTKNQLKFTYSGSSTVTVTSNLSSVTAANNYGILNGQEECKIVPATATVYHAYLYDDATIDSLSVSASVPVTLVGTDVFNRRYVTRYMVYPKAY